MSVWLWLLRWDSGWSRWSGAILFKIYMLLTIFVSALFFGQGIASDLWQPEAWVVIRLTVTFACFLGGFKQLSSFHWMLLSVIGDKKVWTWEFVHGKNAFAIFPQKPGTALVAGIFTVSRSHPEPINAARCYVTTTYLLQLAWPLIEGDAKRRGELKRVHVKVPREDCKIKFKR